MARTLASKTGNSPDLTWKSNQIEIEYTEMKLISSFKKTLTVAKRIKGASPTAGGTIRSLAVKGPRDCCWEPDVGLALCLDVTLTKCDW